MDQIQPAAPLLEATLPEEWAESIARGEADLVAGRVYVIDTDAQFREIEAEADEMERRIAARHASPAWLSPPRPATTS